MKKVFVITNKTKDCGLEFTKELCAIFEDNAIGFHVYAQEDYNDSLLDAYNNSERDFDCIMVLGGDGTLLGAARELAGLNIPILGVNLGNLGYLATCSRDSIRKNISRIQKGEVNIEERMMLEGHEIGNSGSISYALNDVVISRNGPLKVIRYAIYVNGKFLKEYSADGLIVSTPTGSTGYNMSAGGPIIEPGASIMVLTPICPHTLNARSVVLSAKDEVMVKLTGDTGDNLVEASFDGAISIPLNSGDGVVIRKSSKTTKLISFEDLSFLELLQKKMAE